MVNEVEDERQERWMVVQKSSKRSCKIIKGAEGEEEEWEGY